ncbi:fatty-acid amide hydrolase 1-like [Thalassophryne amazonica]|uniref:fatty-acid amide hydrolase 1-like n=1 Tax=Thalassophryne amazonica TaxID=390379 RepID=UPI00147260B8|nr:fatty-acid amide hydrolase 1-like [Thalassophryne amazonica]
MMENMRVVLLGVQLWSWAMVLTAAGCLAAALIQRSKRHHETNNRILRARSRRDEAICHAEQAVERHKESNPKTDSSLLSLSLSELVKSLKEESLHPEDVFYSYMEKALDVNRKLNCCTGVLVESFDQLENLNKEGLLYGVPVSIKENIGYKNHDSTCGLSMRLDQPAQKDSVLVEVLKSQGAIPFVKTNVPQTLFSAGCSNPIYGQTLNPHNHKKTPGGSSGGEVALVAAGGSQLGFGSDIGGSIRVPCSFCGICGFKPTGGRLSSLGVRATVPGTKPRQPSIGPIAKDVDSLALSMQALLCDRMFFLDPTIPPFPFNFQMYQSTGTLRIGYFEADGWVEPSPSMARALREVKGLLERAGHTLVPFKPVRVGTSLQELIMRGSLADGGTILKEVLKGDYVDPCIAQQAFLLCIPNLMKRILSILIKPWCPRVAQSLSVSSGFRSVSDLWKHDEEVKEYIYETIQEWRRCSMDVLLCPVFGPAYNAVNCGRASFAVSHAAVYNLLNFPAGVVPVSTVTSQDEEELKNYKGYYQDKMDKNFKQAVSGGEGLPVAVQCVALPWHDELCLRFMKEVEQLVRQNKKAGIDPVKSRRP